MSEIKKGDLVMCLWAQNKAAQEFFGHIAKTTDEYSYRGATCFFLDPPTICEGKTIVWFTEHLKKIDPPATGEYDGVPVRKTEPAGVL
jgi:hypothetical protein